MQIVLDWLAQLLDLPACFRSSTPEGKPSEGGGVIQGSASEATLVALLAARAQAGAAPEEAHRLVAYGSDQVSHSIALLSLVEHLDLLYKQK